MMENTQGNRVDRTINNITSHTSQKAATGYKRVCEGVSLACV